MRLIGRAFLAILLATASGCARGGGGGPDDYDSGARPPPRDGGTIRLMDGGPPRDSGRPADAGRGWLEDEDAGPLPTEDDAGPLPDAGRGTDAGGSGSCDESPCRLMWPQCGCSGGEGCYIDANGEVGCGTLGDGIEGDPCRYDNDCMEGYQCLGLGAGAVCVQFCESDNDCTGGRGSLCVLRFTNSSGEIPGSSACSIDCYPGNGDGCYAPGTGCTVLREQTGAMRYYTTCRPAGFGYWGDPCSADQDCAGGHFCASGQCYQYCGSDFDCPGFDSYCAYWDAPNSIVVDGFELGYCAD
jgi:hypothetical protein